MTEPTRVLVTDLRAGDETPWYTILDTEPTPNGVKLHVQHQDGGDDYRLFDFGQTVPVTKRGPEPFIYTPDPDGPIVSPEVMEAYFKERGEK